MPKSVRGWGSEPQAGPNAGNIANPQGIPAGPAPGSAAAQDLKWNKEIKNPYLNQQGQQLMQGPGQYQSPEFQQMQYMAPMVDAAQMNVNAGQMQMPGAVSTAQDVAAAQQALGFVAPVDTRDASRDALMEQARKMFAGIQSSTLGAGVRGPLAAQPLSQAASDYVLPALADIENAYAARQMQQNQLSGQMYGQQYGQDSNNAQFNAGNAQQAHMFNAGNQQQANLSNQQAAMGTMGMQHDQNLALNQHNANQAELSYGYNELQPHLEAINAYQLNEAMRAQDSAGKSQLFSNIAGGLLSAGGSIAGAKI